MVFFNIKNLSNIKTLELAYFNLRIAILKNHREDIKFNIDLIKEITKFNPDLIQQLDGYHSDELQKMISMVKNNIIPYSLSKPIENEEYVMEINTNPKTQMNLESDLRDKIFFKDLYKISNLIKIDLKPIWREVANNYGIVDILCKNPQEDEIWILELKKANGDFDLVSQISKYILAYEEMLIHKTYKKIKTLAIANGYSKFCLNELRKLGTTCIHYENVCDELIFKIV